MDILLGKSKRKDKKYMVLVNNKLIHFGQSGAEDFTIHNDETRKYNYIKRHKKREDWTKKGIQTAGFWSRWLLWNKKTLSESIDDIEDKFNVNIII